MSPGKAWRATFDTLHVRRVHRSPRTHEASPRGAPQDLPDKVKIVTKSRLGLMKGGAANNLIARTGEYIATAPNSPRSP